MDFPNTNEIGSAIYPDELLTIISKPLQKYTDKTDWHTQINLLIEKLQQLKFLEKSLIQKTESLLSSIKQSHISLLNSIKSKIRLFKRLLSWKVLPDSSTLEKSKQLNIEKSLKYLNSPSILFSVRNFYSKILTSLDPDQSDQKLWAKQEFLKTHNGGFICMEISPDMNSAFTGSEDSTVRIWDLATMKQTTCFTEHKGQVQCLSLSGDSGFLASGSLDKKVILWNLSTFQLETVFSGHQGAVYCLDFFSKNFIVSGSVANEIIIWSIFHKNIVKKIITSDIITFLLKTGDYQMITATNRYLELWDMVSIPFIRQQSVLAHDKTIWTIALANRRKKIFTGSEDTKIKVWNCLDFSNNGVLAGHSAPVRSLVVTPGEANLVSGSEDKDILLWKIKSLSITHRLHVHQDVVFSVKVFNMLIFSASRDSMIGITNLTSLKCQAFLGTQPFFTGSENVKDFFIAYGWFKCVVVFDVLQNADVVVLDGHEGQVYATCFSSCSKFLISSSEGIRKNLIFWDISKNFAKVELNGHKNSVICVDVAKDDSIAISGDFDGKILIWNLNLLLYETVLSKHRGSVNSVKISSKVNFAVSGGSDLKIIVWDIGAKNVHAIFEGHSQPIWKVLFTMDDKYLVSGNSYDGIRVWSFNPLSFEPVFNNSRETADWISLYSYLKAEFIEFLD